MSDMIERVAIAMFTEYQGRDWKLAPENVKGFHRDCARAAIKAMREPTLAMLKAGEMPMVSMALGNGTTTPMPGLGAGPYSMWPRMIDAALSEALEKQPEQA